MNKNELLRHLGLTQKETAVYLTLLDAPPLSVSDLSRKTGLHRPTVYQTLALLLPKGLVSAVPHGKHTRFVAESPIRIQSLVERLHQELGGMLPAMLHAFESKGEKPIVKFLEGKDGIRSVFEDVVNTLKKGDVFYRYSSRTDKKKADSYLPRDYQAKRDAKQLERFVITNKVMAGQILPRFERSVKIIPPTSDLFDDDVTQIIYADRVAFIDYHTETAVLIENATIATFQIKIFKLLFEKL